MRNAERYPYVTINPVLGEAGFRPYLPINLLNQEQSISTVALLDTGATVNVMPYPIGIGLGYVWGNQTTVVSLTGNLAQFEARVVLVQAIIGQFEPVVLVFAWTTTDQVPLILGQVNFFMEFDVCFYRSQLYFNLCPKALAQ